MVWPEKIACETMNFIIMALLYKFLLHVKFSQFPIYGNNRLCC